MPPKKSRSVEDVGSYALSVKIGRIGLDWLIQLQELYEEQHLNTSAISRGEVMRRALGEALLERLKKKANPYKLDDPATLAYLTVAEQVLCAEHFKLLKSEIETSCHIGEICELHKPAKKKGGKK